MVIITNLMNQITSIKKYGKINNNNKRKIKQKMERISIRLDNYSKLKLNELSQALNTNCSLLIRTIIKDWIEKNETHLNNVIDSYQNNTINQ